MREAIDEIARRWGLPEAAVAEMMAALEPAPPPGSSMVTLGLESLGPTSEATTEERAKIAEAERYQDLGPLGRGGMGEVRRVFDRTLNRTLAMKVIGTDTFRNANAAARFVDEAQCSAQLQHPGIVPIYDFGRLPDGRVWFTMKEVHGRTLRDVIIDVHNASRDGYWGTSGTDWSLRRLVNSLVRVCETMAYAHARSVIHRDLKPANVMVGEHGEVLVLDWGLAKRLGRQDRLTTRPGQVSGTPAYMPPEQARGEVDRLDARSDVFSLGATLYEILSGEHPYGRGSVSFTLRRVLEGPPLALATDPNGTRLPLPAPLVDACERAMAREPNERFPSAAAFAAELTAWLDGSRRRHQALEVIAQARSHGPTVAALRQRAAQLHDEAEQQLSQIPAWESADLKAEGWRKQDEAAALRVAAELEDQVEERDLHGALRIDPDIAEAHGALATRYIARHHAAELARDEVSAARALAMVRSHAENLAPTDAIRALCERYLRGLGALTLVTEPTGANVQLYRFRTQNRRLVPVPERSLGHTPLIAVPLEMGSWLLEVSHPDRETVRYPMFIEREQHWADVPPGEGEPRPLVLPMPGDLGPDDCFVPASWYLAGGDPEAIDAFPRTRLWCDAMVVKRNPVTNREYVAFLDDLVAQGRESDALRYAPRERAGTQQEQQHRNYSRDDKGRFVLVADSDGDVWDPDWPVVNVNWESAVAYTAWLATTTGLPWRLPRDLEWEKAARGVDGRYFPWGDHIDPSWCLIQASHRGRVLLGRVGENPLDASVYGVLGTAGNTRDWCANTHLAVQLPPADGWVRPPAPSDYTDDPNNGRKVIRGGDWASIPRTSRCANHMGTGKKNRSLYIGIRPFRSV